MPTPFFSLRQDIFMLAFAVASFSTPLLPANCFAEGEQGAATASGENTAPAKSSSDAASKKEEKKELVKTGVIASSSTIPDRGAVDVETSGSSPGDETSVVTGSISRTGRTECTAKIINNGEKSYSVSFAVEGTNKRGAKVLSRYFSATVKPKGTVEKVVTGCAEDLNMGVNLKSARASGN